ncbi:MAG: hypothetical protein KBT14_03800 [Proteobacteria bacterium]|nr:hypothetical protein [Candidatus Enterousia onthequi]
MEIYCYAKCGNRYIVIAAHINVKTPQYIAIGFSQPGANMYIAKYSVIAVIVHGIIKRIK